MVAAVAITLSVRLVEMARRYAVDLLFSDQWDVFGALLRTPSTWAHVMLQQGPHRQGPLFIVSRELLWWSGWDVRVEAYAVCITIIAAMGVALLARKRIGGALTVADVAIPLMFLSLTQYGVFLEAPNLSVSAGPLLLLILASAALTLRSAGGVLALGLAGGVLLISGYGFLATPFVGGLILAGAVRAIHRGDRTLAQCYGIAAVIFAIALSLFLVGRVRLSGVDCFRFPDPDWPSYATFISLMYSSFLGVSWPEYPTAALTVGGTVLLLLVIAVGRSMFSILLSAQPEPVHEIVFLLGGFSLTYSAGAAIGRLCMGLGFAQSSRYGTLLIPAFFALYLTALSLTGRGRRRAMAALIIALLLHGAAPWRWTTNETAEEWRRLRSSWRDCYLASGDSTGCSSSSGLQLHPSPATVEWVLEELRRRRLHVYSDP